MYKKVILSSIVTCFSLSRYVAAHDQCTFVTVTVIPQAAPTTEPSAPASQTPASAVDILPQNSTQVPPPATNSISPSSGNVSVSDAGETINGQKLLFFDFPFSTETFPNSRVVRDASNKLQLLDPVSNQPLPGETLQIPTGACQQSFKNGQADCKPGKGQCEHMFIQCKRACVAAIESDGKRFVLAVPDDQQKVLFGPCQRGAKSAVVTMQIPKRPFALLDETGRYVGEFGNPGVACGAYIPNNQECVAKVSSFKKDEFGMLIV